MISGFFRSSSPRSLFAAICAAVVAAFALQACLIDKSAGGGPEEAPDTLPVTVDHVALGDLYHQQGKFAEAMAAYDTALLQDSALSQAYRGYAGALLGSYGVDPADVSADMEKTMKDTAGVIHLLQHDAETLTRRLRASLEVRRILERLVDRDTLSLWNRYREDPSLAPGDPFYAQRVAFIEHYLDTVTAPARRPERFPLTDGRVTHDSVRTTLALFRTVHAITRVYDVNGDGIIDFTTMDSLAKKSSFGNGGSFENLNEIAEDLENDSSLVQDMNALLRNLLNGLSAASNLLSHLAPPPAEGGSQDASQQTQQNIDSVIKAMGSTITFYLMGDGKDNDGDGCIDEEILDGKDNDDDGFVDEDSRIIPGDKPDGVDNDHNGKKDPFLAFVNTVNYDSLEAKVDTGAVPWRLGFVQTFLDAHPDSAWVKIPKDHPDMNLRTKIQEWGLSTKSKAELEGPLKQKLDSAKALVGGCWPNYP